MVKDTLNSMLDNIKERTTNPFLGTLIIIWTIRNWNLVYAIFTFNKNSNLHSRLTYIQQYFNHQSFLWNMFITVLITIGVLIATYTFLALSRLMTDSYEKLLLPQISKITDKSSIVAKSEYVALQEVIVKLELRLEEERLGKVAAQGERDNSDRKLLEALSRPPVTENEMKTNSDIIRGESDNDLNERILRVEKKLDDWGVNDYNNLIDLILDGSSFGSGNAYNKILSFLKREGFVKMSGMRDDYKTYSMTSDGEALIKYTNAVIDSRN